ncbi:MAG: hypothetical protein GX444_13690 [Myxococcales bacterium]|nr:hypothetical protein [Myxococcales bacterium]
MKKVEMVRCYVTSPNNRIPNPEGVEKTVRYVPSDIFRLWRYLMEDVKGFAVNGTVTNFWVDEEMYSKEKDTYGRHETQNVVEVSFVYCRDSEVGRPVIRYFPQPHLENILGFFMKNFSEEYIKGAMQRTIGYFVEIQNTAG